MRLWLDDLRPAPDGWAHAYTVEEAIDLMLDRGPVEDMSLDHDLGHIRDCPGCLADPRDPAMVRHIDAPNGKHFVLWMIEHNCWPKNKPTVHSQNPVGREVMQGLIDRYGPYEK